MRWAAIALTVTSALLLLFVGPVEIVILGEDSWSWAITHALAAIFGVSVTAWVFSYRRA